MSEILGMQLRESEGRNPKEARNPKIQHDFRPVPEKRFVTTAVPQQMRPSGFGFLSAFAFRTSDFGLIRPLTEFAIACFIGRN